MQKIYRKSSIPNLRKKRLHMAPVHLDCLSLAICIIIGIIMAVLIASAYTIAAYPNSNFPSTI